MQSPAATARAAAIPIAAVVAACMAYGSVSAQEEGTLTPGDVVRVDGDFVGTLMSINDGPTLNVVGEGKPTCWPGLQHGEAPRCDPAPSIRRLVDWRSSTVERQLVEVSYTRRTVVGLVLGAAALAPVGYATGPALGYGKIEACYEVTDTVLCTNSLSREEFDARQRRQDQRRGAVAFALLGGSIGAIIARKTANEWVEVRPPEVGMDGAVTLGVTVPVRRR